MMRRLRRRTMPLAPTSTPEWRRRWGSSPSSPTTSTGRTRCASPSRRARRSHPMRSQAWRPRSASPGRKPWRPRFLGGFPLGRTGYFSGPTPSAPTVRSSSTGRACSRPSTATASSPGRDQPDAGRLQRTHPQQREPRRRPPPAARAGTLAAGLPRLVARAWPGWRAAARCLPAHRHRRRHRWLGALRLRQDARLPLGHLPGRARARPAHQLRHPQGRARVAGATRRVSRGVAPPHRHSGRYRARIGGAAVPARAHRALALRPAQSLPGQCRGRPAPLGDGLSAARLLRPRRARGGRGIAGPPRG